MRIKRVGFPVECTVWGKYLNPGGVGEVNETPSLVLPDGPLGNRDHWDWSLMKTSGRLKVLIEGLGYWRVSRCRDEGCQGRGTFANCDRSGGLERAGASMTLREGLRQALSARKYDVIQSSSAVYWIMFQKHNSMYDELVGFVWVHRRSKKLLCPGYLCTLSEQVHWHWMRFALLAVRSEGNGDGYKLRWRINNLNVHYNPTCSLALDAFLIRHMGNANLGHVIFPSHSRRFSGKCTMLPILPALCPWNPSRLLGLYNTVESPLLTYVSVGSMTLQKNKTFILLWFLAISNDQMTNDVSITKDSTLPKVKFRSPHPVCLHKESS